MHRPAVTLRLPSRVLWLMPLAFLAALAPLLLGGDSALAQVANLSATKTATPSGTVIPGGSLTYTIALANSALNTPGGRAIDVSLLDMLPAGFAPASATTTQGTCTLFQSARRVTCTIGAINGGQTATVTITGAVVTDNPPNSLSNSAAVTYTTAVSRQTQTIATNMLVTQVGRPNLTVAVQDTPDPVEGGGTISYAIAVTNSGTAPVDVPAGAVLLRDTLSNGAPAPTFVSGSGPAGYSCVQAAGVVNCTATAADTIAPAATRDFTVTVTAPSTPVGPAFQITNTATADPGNVVVESSHADNTATTQTTVAFPNLGVSIADSPDPTPGGAMLTYVVTVSNGNVPAPGVTAKIPVGALLLRVALPAGVSAAAVSGAPAGYNCAVNQGTPVLIECTASAADAIPLGASRQFTFTVTAPTSVGAITATATVNPNGTIAESDTTPASNTATATTDVRLPNLTVALATTNPVSPAAAVAGATVTYRLTVGNAAGATSVATPANVPVVVRNTLPATATFVAFAATGGFNCTPPPAGPGGVFSCSRAAVLNPGDSAVIEFTATATTQAAVMQDAAEVDPTNTIPESNEGDNVASVNTPVTLPDLTVVKAAPVAVATGSIFSYTLTVSLSAPSRTLDNIVVQDMLPAGVAFVSANGTNNFTCGFLNGTVTCTGGTIAGGANANITLIVVSPFVATTISNTAMVDPANVFVESNDANNTSPAAVTNVLERTKPDLRLTLSAAPAVNPPPPPAAPVPQGQNLIYTLTVFNDTPGAIGDAENVRVHDTLPAGATFVSADSTNGFLCAHIAGAVQCTGGVIPVGGNATIRITVTVTAPPGTIVNSAVADPFATVDETNENNNTASVSTTVITAVVNLTIGKSANAAVVGPFALLTYTLTPANTGGIGATSVTVRDVLPAGVLFVTATGTSGFTCSYANATVTCIGGSLAAGGSATITISVLTPSVATTLVNRAETDPANTVPESNESDNLSPQVTVNVVLPDLQVATNCTTPVLTGAPIQCDLVVTNNSVAQTSNVIARNVLPPGASFQSFLNQGSMACQLTGSVVSCGGASMAPGAAVTISFRMTAPNTPGTLQNTGEVDPFNVVPESNEANNASTAAIVVNGTVDLTITKSAPANVAGGETFSYTLTVSNAGTGPFNGTVTVRDALPGAPTIGFNGFTATNGFTCSYAAPNVLCTRTGMAAGESRDITFSVTAPATAGLLSNTATVDAAPGEINPGNNTSTAPTTVGLADLLVQVARVPDGPVGNCTILRFFITVTNVGAAPARNVRVGLVDAPTGNFTSLFLLASAGSNGFTCGVFGNSAACANGEISNAPGQNTATLIVFVQVLGGNPGTTDTFVAEVDPAPGIVPESNEFNNQSTPITVIHG